MTVQELISLRKQLKVSLLELAASTGLMEDYLTAIEDGRVVPLEGDLKRMEKALLKMKADPERMKDLAERERLFSNLSEIDEMDESEDETETL